MKKMVLDKSWQLNMLEPCASLEEKYLKPIEEGKIIVQKMPAQVADILRSNRLIEDPYLPGKAEEYQWIARKDWLYTVSFKGPDWKGPWHLSCKGLDTIADIYLNGVKIDEHKNVFLPYEVDITAHYKPCSENILQIHFHSVPLWLENGPFPEGMRDKNPLAFLRKTGVDFREYLGMKPFFVRVGVFDEISLVAEETGVLEEVVVDTALDRSMEQGQITIRCNGSYMGKSGCLKMHLDGPDDSDTDMEWPLSD